jgi:hypothetical protein
MKVAADQAAAAGGAPTPAAEGKGETKPAPAREERKK